MRRRYSRSRALVLVAALPPVWLAAPRQSPPAPAAPGPPIDEGRERRSLPAEAERMFKDLLQRFFEAYARKDLEGMTALWHPGGPARYRRNVVLVEFDLRQVELAGLAVRNAGADPGGGRARAILDLTVTDEKTGRCGASAGFATSPSCRTTPAPGRSGTRCPRRANWRDGSSRVPAGGARRAGRVRARDWPRTTRWPGCRPRPAGCRASSAMRTCSTRLTTQARLARVARRPGGRRPQPAADRIAAHADRTATRRRPGLHRGAGSVRRGAELRRGRGLRRQPGQPRLHAGPVRRGRRRATSGRSTSSSGRTTTRAWRARCTASATRSTCRRISRGRSSSTRGR